MELKHCDTRNKRQKDLERNGGGFFRFKIFGVSTSWCLSVVFLCFIVLVSQCLATEEYSKICFQQACFTIEVADEPVEQMKGLMSREELPEDQGMLFVFDEDQRYSFWMKNTLIPLDMIWLDKDMRVVYIESNVPPCEEEPCSSYSPPVAARYVLELNAGVAKNIRLNVGDVVETKSLKE